jgi:phytoene dehydrogenase-like protein
VGAGHNALVAAAYLLDAGRSVCLPEQMAQPGGWVQTAELGAPGFHHDRWSALHPFFVGGPAWAELGPDLSRHGLEYVTAPLATASSLPDGRAAVAPVDPEAFAVELERLGETAGWNALFTPAGPPSSGTPGPAGRWPEAGGDVVMLSPREDIGIALFVLVLVGVAAFLIAGFVSMGAPR